jgi:hypothetical protein
MGRRDSKHNSVIFCPHDAVMWRKTAGGAAMEILRHRAPPTPLRCSVPTHSVDLTYNLPAFNITFFLLPTKGSPLPETQGRNRRHRAVTLTSLHLPGDPTQLQEVRSLRLRGIGTTIFKVGFLENDPSDCSFDCCGRFSYPQVGRSNDAETVWIAHKIVEDGAQARSTLPEIEAYKDVEETSVDRIGTIFVRL